MINTSREIYSKEVLNLIINNKEISRVDISKIIGLNKTTTSSIVNQLIEKNLVKEIGIGDSTKIGGRKPILLSLFEHSATVIVLDIGKNYISYFLSYINGDVIIKNTLTNLNIEENNLMSYLSNIINHLFKQLPATPNGLVGLALGVHGITHNNKITFSPFYNINNLPLHKLLSEKYNVKVLIENEANLAALGEYTFHSKSNRLININIRDGIGAGIIENGEILKGNNGAIGEIGHTILFPNGITCPCGNKGCLEMYASASVLFEKISSQKKLKHITLENLLGFWHKHDDIVLKELRNNLDYLTISINNIITTLNPDEIILNSSYLNNIPEAIKYIDENINSIFSQNTKVLSSNLGEEATLFGGIALLCQKYLEITDLKLLF